MRPVRKADNLTIPCAVVMKYENLYFLELSGPLQACNGTALPLPYTIQEIFVRFRDLKHTRLCNLPLCLLYESDDGHDLAALLYP